MSAAPDIVIVGGGIVGLAMARQLAGEGREVLLLEGGRLAEGCTAAAMGHLVTLDASPGQLALTRLGVRLWGEISSDLEGVADYTPCGTIWLATTEVEASELATKASRYKNSGVEAELLSPQELHHLEPKLRPDLAGAVHVKPDAVVDHRRVARYFADEAVRRGARILEHHPVRRVSENIVTLDSGEEVHAEVIVIAAGVGSAKLIPELPIRPRKGHLMQFGMPSGYVTHQIAELGYARAGSTELPLSISFDIQPRSDGTLWVGASRQNGTQVERVEQHVVDMLRTRATQFLPDFGSLPLQRAWTGFRPATPDDLPFLGPLGGQAGVFVAAGHEGFGITTCLATALVISNMIDSRPAAIPVDPFRPDRFAQ